MATASETEFWMRLAPVKAGSGDRLPEQIARQVERLIRGGELRPGSRLPSERELARIFGVSRLAVREATQRLEARELVAVRRSSGTFVAEATSDAFTAPTAPLLPAGVDTLELYEIRRLLEPAAAEWAALRAESDACEALERLADRFDEAVTADEPLAVELLAMLELELHLQIARAADNALLVTLIEQLADRHPAQLGWSLQRPGRLGEIAREHRSIVDAIARRDPAAAREAMLVHLAAANGRLRVVDESDTVD